jgi:hypothetical protein
LPCGGVVGLIAGLLFANRFVSSKAEGPTGDSSKK